MKSLIEWLVDHTTTVMIAVFAVFVFGTLAYVTLPRESAPDISIPVVLVTTPYPGVSPGDIEELISTPLENELASLRDIEKLSSSSAEGFSIVSIEFTPDVDIEEALQRVRDRVGRARSKLPDDVDEPSVREINFSDIPVLLITLAGPSETELVALAEDLEEELGRMMGVLEAKVSGGVERQIRVQVDPLRLAHYGLSLGDVMGAIQNENVNIPGGNVDVGQGDFLVRTPGTFEHPLEIANVAIKRVGDRPVFIRDVATVVDGFADRNTYARMQGESSVTVSVTKRPGANIVELADNIRTLTAERSEAWPDDVTYRILADQSEQIAQTVSELQNNIITALFLVVGVIVFFMGLRNSLFVAMAIPGTMLMSFMTLQALGYTLNMVVLFSLILALGMLVDNAIVVVENVYRWVETGSDVRTAAIEGTYEVAMAVTASTATTVGAFLPLVFWTGIMGEFMGFMPKTVIIVLVSSLVVAVVALPVFMKTLMAEPARAGELESDMRNRDLGFAMGAYRSLLEWSIRWKWVSVFAGVASLVVTVGIYAVFSHGIEFFPEADPERAIVAITLPDGADLDTTDQVARAAELLIAVEQEVDTWVTEVGVSGGGNPLLMSSSGSPNEAKITINFKPDRNSAERGEAIRSGSTSLAVQRLREAMQVIPGATIAVEPEAMGPPVGDPISVQVSGEDFYAVGELAKEVRREIAKIPGVTDLSDDFRVGRPELRLRVDRGAAKRVGVSTAQVGNAVRNAIAGSKASTLRLGEDEVDIVVELAEAYREDVQTVLGLRLPGREDTSPDTFPVPLSAVASWEFIGGSGAIQHVDQDLVVTISGDVATGFNENEVQAAVTALLEAWDTPEGMHMQLGGAQDDQQESMDFLMRAFLVSVALIAMVLVTQFDSITTPLIILATVVLSLIGVLWGLMVTGTPYGIIMTSLGVFSLAGVVVNNAIVLLDYVEQLRSRGLSVEEALIEAGLTRFRPVMLTAITTTLGLVPMAIGLSFDFSRFRVLVGGASAQWWGPMAIAVIFGLTFATLLTLVMVPTLYSLNHQLGQWRSTLFARLRGGTATAAAKVLIGLTVLAVSAPAEAVTLQEAWTAAEQHSTQLRISQEQLIQTGTNRGKALATIQPQVDARVTYIRNQREIPLDFDFSSFAPTLNPEVEAALEPLLESQGVEPGTPLFVFPDTGGNTEPQVFQRKEAWQAEFGVSQRLWSGSALPGYRSAVALTQAAELDVEQTRIAVKEQVASAFFGLQTAREAERIAAASLESATHRQELATRQVDAGLAPPRALTQARLDVAVAQREVESARRARIEAEEGFFILTGLRDVALDEAGGLAVPTDVESALSQARIHRKDLQASRLRIKAAQRERTARDFQWSPTIDGRFAYIYDQNTLIEEKWNWRATVTASWVLWDGGLRLANHRETASRVRAAEITEQATMRAAEQEIRVAWESYQVAQAVLDASQSERQLADENLLLAERGFEAGANTFLDVEQAQIARLSSELAQLQARQQRELAAIRLAAAMGTL